LEKRITLQKKKTSPVEFSINSPAVIVVESEKKSKTAIGVWEKTPDIQYN